MTSGPKPIPLVDRFQRYAVAAGPYDCWLWTGKRQKRTLRSGGDGYGQILVGSRTTGRRYAFAHRVAWELAHGPIPDGLCVLHRCDVRLCVNPSHLFLGTKRDNTRDALSKGRLRSHFASKDIPPEARAAWAKHASLARWRVA